MRWAVAAVTLVAVAALAGCKCPPVKVPGEAPKRMVAAAPARPMPPSPPTGKPMPGKPMPHADRAPRPQRPPEARPVAIARGPVRGPDRGGDRLLRCASARDVDLHRGTEGEAGWFWRCYLGGAQQFSR